MVFAFLQTWFQPYVNVNHLLYHCILITCVLIIVLFWKFRLCVFLCFYTSCPCSTPLITLICWCASITCHTNSVSFVTSWFHIKINVFRHKCFVYSHFLPPAQPAVWPFISLFTPPQQHKPDQCVPPLRRTSRLCRDSHFKLPKSSTSKVKCTHTKWLVIKDTNKFNLVCFLWWTALKVFTESRSEKKFFNKGL